MPETTTTTSPNGRSVGCDLYIIYSSVCLDVCLSRCVQVALCQGHCNALKAPSLSLHHHFHDCLYLLVRGHLRLRIFPPTVIPLLRSSRCALKIHSNGLAVYLPAEKRKQKAACLRADGVPMISVARMKRDNAEKNLIEAGARLMQLRNAGADGKPEMAEELEEATRVVKDCELLVDETSDQLQRSVVMLSHC